MSLSESESAILHFYTWEYQGRGYSLFDKNVELEPLFTPFYHYYPKSKFIDDGEVPSVFEKVRKLLFKPETKELEIKYQIQPRYIKKERELVALGFSFEKGESISFKLNLAFLNMLCGSYDSLAFEIIANGIDINFQLTCSIDDKELVEIQLKAYFPNVRIVENPIYNFDFNFEKPIAIADLGLENEFMYPISRDNSYDIDPLTSLISQCNHLQENERLVFQVLFQSVKSSWATSMNRAVTSGVGKSFFIDDQELPKLTLEKTAEPLFACVLRIAAQGKTKDRSKYIAHNAIKNVQHVSQGKSNRLLPLSNDDYDYNEHLINLHERRTNRSGMILNVSEIAQFVHYPNKNVVFGKLKIRRKTKALPTSISQSGFALGTNRHEETENTVSINPEQLTKHCHILGATGVGKSTLLVNMALENIKAGYGCSLFDPHGDIIDDILDRIPDNRKNDVVLIDPSDTDFPVGFNLLHAETELEKIVLSSDLIYAFKRHATAWGDNMTAVLTQAIYVFLESDNGGTLLELKRFLLEDEYRNTFLQSVKDSSIHYYWNYEFPMIKKGIAPLITRIDTFLRPKIIRRMFAQKSGIDFKKCLDQNKIVLIKLSQGLIGRDNSYLLGSLFLSKYNQAAKSRQLLSKNKRTPYFLYIDECHHFMNPGISDILSGARKYGLGLILAHQNLAQIDDKSILSSIRTNPFIKICFKLGHEDAQKMESQFSFFNDDDLQNLGVGECILEIGGKNQDFNMETIPPIVPDNNQSVKDYIIQNTHDYYSKTKDEVEQIIEALLPSINQIHKRGRTITKKTESYQEVNPTSKNQDSGKNNSESENLELDTNQSTSLDKSIETPSEQKTKDFEKQKQEYLTHAKVHEETRKHRSIQKQIRTLGMQRGYLSKEETPTESNGRIDVTLVKDNLRIAVEVSVTNRADYEVKNLQKCLDADYNLIFMISDDEKHLSEIKSLALKRIEKKHHKILQFIESKEFSSFLDMMESPLPQSKTKTIRGYKVKTSYTVDSVDSEHAKKQKSIHNIILNAIKNQKKK